MDPFLHIANTLLSIASDETRDGRLRRADLCSILRELDPSQWNIEKVDRLMQSAGAGPTEGIYVEDFMKWLFSDRGAALAMATKNLEDAPLPQAATQTLPSAPASFPPQVSKAVHTAWSTQVPVPIRYSVRRACIERTEHRAITAEQLNDLVELVQEVLSVAIIVDTFSKEKVDWEKINMYILCDHFLKPLSAPFWCSFVELVAEDAQPPCWFVSHWWGTPLRQTHSLLNFHACKRNLPATTPYWICTFANNQHDLSELGGSLRETPFVKAILSHQCMGTLTLLDNKVTPFERIWCVLENFVSTTWAREEEKDISHLMDIAAWLSEGSATYGGTPVPAKPTLRMDLGGGGMKIEVDEQSKTGGAFPLSVSVKGVQICLAQANSSREQDKRNILHLIAGTPEDEWDSREPPLQCEAYDKLDNAARRLFVGGALYGVAQRGNAQLLSQLVATFPDHINERYNGATALYIAAWKNKHDALAVLLKTRADPNKQKEGGASAVLIATQSGHSAIVHRLLRAAADPNLARADGVAPVHMAAQQCKPDILKALLASRAHAGALDQGGRTPLHVAVSKADVECVKLLLSNAADPNVTSKKGFTPHRLAQQVMCDAAKTMTETTAHQEIVDVLLEAKASPFQASPSAQNGNHSPHKGPSLSESFSNLSQPTSPISPSFSNRDLFSTPGGRPMQHPSGAQSWMVFDSPTGSHSPLRPRTVFEDAGTAGSRPGMFQVQFGNTRRWLESGEERPEHESRSAKPDAVWAEWALEIRFERPEEEAYVTKVVYTLHNSFSIPVEAVLQPPFRVTRKGWGCFHVKAEVHLQDGQVTTLMHRLRFDGPENFTVRELPIPSELRSDML